MSEKEKEPVAPDAEIALEYPITHGSEQITVIGLKRPKGKHLKNLVGRTDEEKTLLLACKLSGHPMSVFDEMDAVDIQKVSEAIESFLGNGRKVGAEPLPE